VALTAADYLQTLQASLLKGKAWVRNVGSMMTALWSGVAQEFARIHQRIDDLMNEADPRTTTELIDDWENFAGLPDPCVTIDQTLEQRRIALNSKLLMVGGQSRQYFIDLAEAMGYPDATIDEYNTFNAGESGAGDAIWSEDDRFAWQINLPSTGAITYFKAGESSAGEPLQSWGDEAIECRINRFKPTHTTAVFAYV
jgi:uncharacterized protein YmfQ (DUF2313 family)